MKSTIKIFMPAMLAAIASASVGAQELSGSLTAVGDYKAEVRQHSRRSGLPSRLSLPTPEGSLSLALNGVEVAYTPQVQTQRTDDSWLALPDTYPGYVALTSGSYLSTSLSAGYRFLQTEQTTIGAWLQHCSSSLFRPDVELSRQGFYPIAETATQEQPVTKTRKKLYDETIGLYASHSIAGAGRLSGTAAYHLSYFNYYSNLETIADKDYAPSQTLNDFSLRANWDAERKSQAWYVDGSLAYRYFGYRRFYTPQGIGAAVKAPGENDLQLSATAGYTTRAGGVLSMQAAYRALMYASANVATDVVDMLIPSWPFDPRMEHIRNYGIFTLTPSYSLSADGWSLHLGARVDLSHDVVGGDFATFHIAPDVAFSYTTGRTIFYTALQGGVEPNTLSSRSELNTYQSPALINTMPQYSPIDAVIGLKLGDFSGVSGGVHFGYTVADNTPLTGWYPYWMHLSTPLSDAYPVGLSTLSIKGFTIGADMSYTLGRLLTVSGDIAYQRQSGKHGYFNGADRPRWVIGLDAELTPIAGLAIGASYNYRGVRTLYIADYWDIDRFVRSHNYTDQESLKGIRLPDIYDLGFRASYTLSGRYTFSAAIDNVLGCDDRLNPLMPTEDTMITGGVSILF